jgi:hypothetical protein
MTFYLLGCGPTTGLNEIVEHTQLTVKGTVTLAESSLTLEEDGVYTDYIIDVARMFRHTNHSEGMCQ